jgi:hypothetical protein
VPKVNAARLSPVRFVRAARRTYRTLRLLLKRLDEVLPGLERLEDDRSHEQINASYEPWLTRLAATQALVARVYEQGFNWPEQVRAMREEPDYWEAWEGEPLITVRIATYNKADVLVERAVASLLRQTYDHWEAVIVGDCCSDNTAERIASLGDPRLRFENLPVRGPYPEDPNSFWFTAGIQPMNRGLELARGAWVAALDDDDAWDDDHLEVLLRSAKESHAEVVYGKYRLLDVETSRLIAHDFGGAYPPVTGAIGFQAALCLGKLSRFKLDMNCHLAGEPGDRNLGRRLWEAGVRFHAVDRAVSTYWFEPKNPWGHRFLTDVRAAHGYSPLHIDPTTGRTVGP